MVRHLRRIAASPLAEPGDRIAALEALHSAHLHVSTKLLTELLSARRRRSAVATARLLTVAQEDRPSAAPGLRRALRAMLDAPTTNDRLADRAEGLARLLLTARRQPPRAIRALVDRLLARSRGERWGATRGTAWALRALAAAERRLAPLRTAIEARAWLEGRHWGGRLLDARRLDLHCLHAPRSVLSGVRKLQLRARRGGPLYYRVALRRRRPRRVSPRTPASLAVDLEPIHGGRRGSAYGPLRLRVGQNHVARVTVVTTRTLPATVLRVPIPAGCDVVDAGYPDERRSHRPHHRFPPLPILDAARRAGALWLHLGALPPGIHEHRLVIQAAAPGRFGCAPASLHRARDDRRLAAAGHCRALVVEDAPSTRYAPALAR